MPPLRTLILATLLAFPSNAFAQADLRLVFGNANGGGCGQNCNPPAPGVYTGGISSYGALIENAGPNPASAVVLTITLPPQVVIGPITAHNVNCNVAQGVVSATITCTAASLPVAVAAASVSFGARLSETYPYQNGLTATATLTSATADPSPGDNSAIDTVPVYPAPIPAGGPAMFIALIGALALLGVFRSVR
jgi:uncharacterized repeat protein (TIGR01451 family)